MNKYITVISITVLSAVLFTGCASTQSYSGSRAIDKAVIGATVGGIVGAAVGHQSGERDAGAAVGAATGAAVGYAWGNEQDKKRIVRRGPNGQKIIVVQRRPQGSRGITCRPPRPRSGYPQGYPRSQRGVRTPPGSEYDRYGRHHSGEFRLKGAPPPRPPRPTW